MILVAGAEKQLFPEGSVLRPLLFKFFYSLKDQTFVIVPMKTP